MNKLERLADACTTVRDLAASVGWACPVVGEHVSACDDCQRVVQTDRDIND